MCRRALSFTEIKILNHDGNECGPNEVGEVSQAVHIQWLLAKRKGNSDAFDGEWLLQVTLQKKMKMGSYIVDRKTDMIISGGINIYPREIEEILLGMQRSMILLLLVSLMKMGRNY